MDEHFDLCQSQSKAWLYSLLTGNSPERLIISSSGVIIWSQHIPAVMGRLICGYFSRNTAPG